MHNREITDSENRQTSSSKHQLVVRTKCSFCCNLRETYIKTKQFYDNTMLKLDLRLKIQILYLPPFALNI